MLETERLLLRKPTAADADMRFHLEQWTRNGIGKFVVVRRDDGAVVGRVGIQLLDPETWQPVEAGGGQPELGWTLRERYRGHGYATEAVIPPDNVRSQAVARRLGAVPGAEVHVPADGTYVIWEHMQG